MATFGGQADAGVGCGLVVDEDVDGELGLARQEEQ